MANEIPDKKAKAEQRRRALRTIMQERGVNPTDLARLAGWVRPNVIYNFLAGRSNELTTANYADICRALPGVTMADLMGEPAAKVLTPVLVITECRAGVTRDSFSLPAQKIREVPLPMDDDARTAGAFAAIVSHPGADQIYPDKSLLLCLPINRFEGNVGKGRRVLVERLVDDKVETTVREIQEDADLNLWLSNRSNDPRFATAIRLPARCSNKPWRHNGEKFALAGIVIGAFIPER